MEESQIKHASSLIEVTEKHKDLIRDCHLEIGEGWLSLVDDLFDRIKVIINNKSSVYVSCVKEKYGTLRVYVNDDDDWEFVSDAEHHAIHEIIDLVTDKSYETCEVCGNEGKIRYLSWHKTLCDNHFNPKEK